MGRRGAVQAEGAPKTYVDAAPLLVAVPAAGAGNATIQEAIDSIKRGTLVFLRAAVPVGTGVNPYVIATAGSIVLPDTAKAAILLADTFECPWIRAAGSAATGQMTTTSTTNAAPTTRKGMIAPNGDIIVLGTDLITSMDFSYLPIRQDVVSGTYSVTAGTGVVAGLPSGMISILEGEILAGGVTGKCVVNLPAATAPATRICNLNLPKDGVFFCIADAVTSVRLKLGVIPVETY